MSCFSHKSGIVLLTSLVCFSQNSSVYADCTCQNPTVNSTSNASYDSCDSNGNNACSNSGTCTGSACTFNTAWGVAYNYGTATHDTSMIISAAVNLSGNESQANSQPMGIGSGYTFTLKGGSSTSQSINGGTSNLSAPTITINSASGGNGTFSIATPQFGMTNSVLRVLGITTVGFDLASAGWSSNNWVLGTDGTGLTFNSSVGSSGSPYTDKIYLGYTNNGISTLTAASGYTVYLSGVIANYGSSNIGGLSLNGNFVLGGANTYTHGTTINSSSIVRITNASAFGTGSVSLSGTLQLGTSSATISHAITLNSGATIDLYGETNTLSGVLSGSGRLSITDSIGSGVLMLGTGNSAFSNGVSIASGTLRLSSSSSVASQIGAGTVTMSGGTMQAPGATFANSFSITGGTFDLYGGNSSINGTISGNTGPFTVTDSVSTPGNTLTFGSSCSYSGAITISNATLAVNLNNTFSPSSIALSSGTLQVTNSSGSAISLNPTITGSGTLLIASSTSPITFGKALNSSIVLNVASGGTFNPSVSQTIKNLLGAGTLNLPTGVSLTTSSGTATFSGVIAGAGSVVINNTQTFSQVNTFSGGLTLNSGGTLTVSLAGGVGSGTIYGNAGSLIGPGSSIEITNSWSFSGGGVISNTNTLSEFTLTGSITTTGSGDVSIPASLTLFLNPSSLNIIAGTSLATSGNDMTVVSTGAFGAGTGTLSLGLASSSSSTPPTIDTLTFTGASYTFPGVIANNGSGLGAVVINAPSSTITLSGANTFTGGLTLTSGTLSISSNTNAGNASTQNPNRIIFNGGTLQNSTSTSIAFTNNPITLVGGTSSSLGSGGSFAFSGPFTITAGTAALVNSSTSLTLTPNYLTMAGGSTLAISGADSTLNITGSLIVTGSGSATITNSGGSITLAPTSLSIATAATFATGNNNISVQSFPNSTSLVNAGTLSLGSGTLTIPSGNSSTFYGAITGTGGVVVQGQVGFFGTSTFTGGVTLTSGSLTIQGAGGVGASTNTITGNGGTLTVSGATASVSLANPWIFNAAASPGITTTLNVGSGQTLSLTGSGSSITTVGAGTVAAPNTAIIYTSAAGSLSLAPDTLDIIAGTTLQINGNTSSNSSISTNNLIGSGNLVLGGGTITGTLTIGGSGSTFSGTVGGKAAVVINLSGDSSVVTFNGTAPSTLTGGLTLTKGILSISTSNLSPTATDGNLIFNGGTLSNSGTGGSSSVITFPNPVTFTGGTTAHFENYFKLTGSLAIVGANGSVATLLSSPAGTLTVNPSSLSITTNVSFQTAGQLAGNTLTIGTFGSGSGTLILGPLSGTGTDTLTISSNNSSSFGGVIADANTGASRLGAVIIKAPVTFSGSNTFTGGLTLTSGSLTISAASGVGASTNTITGNGGTLTTAASTAISLSNPWTFNVGTTTLNVGNSSTLGLTGAITATGSGVAIISGTGSGTLTLNPSTLTINSTSLQVVGNNAANSSITTANISGTGNLILGGTTTSSLGTLTLSGVTSNFTYAGSITDNPATSTGKGAVVIAAGSSKTVTFTGVNTFSGGLTLTSGTLAITAANQIGSSSGNIIGNGGILSASLSNVSLLNPLVLNVSTSTSTTFQAVTAGTTLTLTGPISIATGAGAGTATIGTNSGSGTVIFNPSMLTVPTGYTLATNGNSIMVGSGTVQGSFGTGSGTISLGSISGSVMDTLTIASSKSTVITFGGSIVDEGSGGTGAVVIEAIVSFTGNNNTFSGGLTLSPSLAGGSGITSSLTISPTSSSSSPLGIGTITGSGGALFSTASFAVINPLALTGGTTTTFGVNTNGLTLTFSGPMSTLGTGTAGISTSGTTGTVSFTPSALTIASGTSLQTNGNSITVNGALTGSGGLILGGNGGTDTLTLAGSGSNYSGIISDNPAAGSSGGKGQVVINATSALSGNNTFSGGLVLNSTLTITSANSGSSNVGATTAIITFNGGTLKNSASGAGSSITLSNPVVFTGGTTSAFTNYFTLTQTSTGPGSLTIVKGTVGNGVAKVLSTPAGALTLNPSVLSINPGSTFATSGNSITVGNVTYPGTFGGSTYNGTLSLGSTSGAGTDTLTISGPVSGSTTSTTFYGIIRDSLTAGTGIGAVVMNAPRSNVTFTQPNPFSGGLTLTAGTLTISNANQVGTGLITGNGGTLTSTISTVTLTNLLTLNSGTTTTFTVGGITTSGSLGSGTLELGGFTSGSGSSQTVTPGVLTLNGATTFSGAISNGNSSGAQVIIAAGAGFTVSFSGLTASTFTGGLFLNTGTLAISNAGNLGSGTITGNGATLSTNSTMTITNAVVFNGGTTTTLYIGSGTTTLTGALSISSTALGTVTLTKTGTGILSLTPSSLTVPTNSTLITNGNSIVAGSISGGGVLSLGATTTTDTLTIASASTFSGNIVDNIVGSGIGGAVVIKASTTLSGINTFSQGLTLTSGTLTISKVNQVGTGTITGNGGTLSTTSANAVTLINPLSLTASTKTTFIVAGIKASSISGSGNLSIGGFTSGSGSSAIVTPGVLTITGTSSYSGVISDSSGQQGAVEIQAGVGVVTLSGSNTFSGGMKLTSGTLSISSTNNIGSSSGTITGNGGTLLSTGSFTLKNPLILNSGTTTAFTVTGLEPSSFTGSGNLSLAGLSGGVGTLTIQEAATYGGVISDNTTIPGGTAAVVIDAGTTGTGNSAVNNVVTFSGVNTFSGGLTLTSGTLAFTSVTNIGWPSPPITGNGGTLSTGVTGMIIANDWTLNSGSTTTIEVDATTTNLTLSGDLSGSGALTKTGTGILTLTGANTFEGALTIGSSTVGGGTFVINGSLAPASIPHGVVTTVNSQSTLTVGGSGFSSATLYSSAVPGTVNVYGALTGAGTIYGTVTLETTSTTTGTDLGFTGAIVKPGNSIGTLTITGDLDFLPGSIYALEFSPTAASKLIVTGLTTIESGAQVTALMERGTYDQPVTYTIAEALGGFTGQFTTVRTVPGVYLSAILFFDGPTLLNTTITPESFSGGGLAKGSNAMAVALAIDESIIYNRANVEWKLTPEGIVALVPSEISDVIESLIGFTTADEMTYALNQLHPALFKGMTIVQQNNAVEVRETLSNRMQNELDSERCFVIGKDRDDKDSLANRCHKEKKSLQVWASGFGDVLAQDSQVIHSNPEIGYQSKMAGAVLGVDKRFAKHYYVGALGGYTSSHVHFKQGKGTGDVNSGYAGLYASAIGKMFYGNISATVGWNEFSAKRNIIYPGVNLAANNEHLGTQLLSHLDTGVNIGFKGITLRPFDSFDYVAQREKAYTETGAGEWNLHVHKTNAILIRNELGLQLSGCVCFKSSKWTVAPKLSWVREVRVKGNSFVAEFETTNSPFEVVGYYPDRSLLSPGVVVSGSMLQDRLTLGAYYNGEFKGGYSSHNYGGELRFGF